MLRDKKIISYKTNRFNGLVIFNSLFIVFWVSGISFNKLDIHWISILFSVALLSKLTYEILWLNYGVISIYFDKNITIKKELFRLTINKKNILSPFKVSVVDNLKSEFDIGIIYHYNFYHSKGLCFSNEFNEGIYSVELSDKLDSKIILNKINSYTSS